MSLPEMSNYFQSRKPSAIRLAQIEFANRIDHVNAINTAIGNVSLPMHPAMVERLFHLDDKNSPFKDGVVKYTATVGQEETNQAFLNIIASSGYDTRNLYSQIIDGGSQGMELAIIGTCGPAGSSEKPLLLLDPAYTNYNAFAGRLGRCSVSVTRVLQDDGQFTLPDFKLIEQKIIKTKPGAMVVIPFDNPTGQFIDHESLVQLAKLCVKYNLWMICDEAYRELFYTNAQVNSIWSITNKEVPGVEGRRISIETTSKVWNACGLRIGALVTDNPDFHRQSIAEYTANLCPNAIGQYIFGALAHVEHSDLKKWYQSQREYYYSMLTELTSNFKELLPEIIISSPDASIYSVIDVRNIAKPEFNALDFVIFCARKGKVVINDQFYTLLVAPMGGFYSVTPGQKNPGHTQMRVAYVEPKDKMKLVPELFCKLFNEYEAQR